MSAGPRLRGCRGLRRLSGSAAQRQCQADGVGAKPRHRAARGLGSLDTRQDWLAVRGSV